MINYTNIVLNTTGLTMEHSNLKYVCELDSINMMNDLAKTSKEAYYILLIGFALLFSYMFIPKLQEIFKPRDIHYYLFMILLTSIFFYTYTTFNITSEIQKRIDILFWIVVAIGIIYIIWKNRNKIIDKLREE